MTEIYKIINRIYKILKQKFIFKVNFLRGLAVLIVFIFNEDLYEDLECLDLADHSEDLECLDLADHSDEKGDCEVPIRDLLTEIINGIEAEFEIHGVKLSDYEGEDLLSYMDSHDLLGPADLQARSIADTLAPFVKQKILEGFSEPEALVAIERDVFACLQQEIYMQYLKTHISASHSQAFMHSIIAAKIVSSLIVKYLKIYSLR